MVATRGSVTFAASHTLQRLLSVQCVLARTRIALRQTDVAFHAHPRSDRRRNPRPIRGLFMANDDGDGPKGPEWFGAS